MWLPFDIRDRSAEISFQPSTAYQEVAEVLNVKGQGNKRQYLVKWEGYPLSESTWEPRSHFKISPELMMHRPSRSTSRGRKSDAPSPSRRLASKSPSRSKTAGMKSSPTKGEGVTRSPLSKRNVGRDSASKGKLAKSPARKNASSRSPVKRAVSDKKRPSSKSPSRASKRTPSKQKTTVKSSEKPTARSRSRSRPRKLPKESKSTTEVPAAPAPISSTAFTKRFEPSFLQPLTRSTAFSFRSTAAREPSGEMAIRHRAPASSYPRVISQSARSRKMAELKKYVPMHFRLFWRFYVIIFSLAFIGLIVYHFGYSVKKTLKQLQKQIDNYIYSMKKQ
uniref:Chromo domain-containing protein n=1 Tax=Ascaris lumbricoides TaxID=6252 RepID=A0A0M3HS72_ASCLU